MCLFHPPIKVANKNVFCSFCFIDVAHQWRVVGVLVPISSSSGQTTMYTHSHLRPINLTDMFLDSRGKPGPTHAQGERLQAGIQTPDLLAPRQRNCPTVTQPTPHPRLSMTDFSLVYTFLSARLNPGAEVLTKMFSFSTFPPEQRGADFFQRVWLPLQRLLWSTRVYLMQLVNTHSLKKQWLIESHFCLSWKAIY